MPYCAISIQLTARAQWLEAILAVGGHEALQHVDPIFCQDCFEGI